MSHAGRFFCLFQLNMLFAKSSLCPVHVMVSAGHQQRGSRFLRRRLPGDGGSEAQLALPANTKHDPALSRGVGREATTASWLGITSLQGETQPPIHSGATLLHSGSRAPRGRSLPPLCTVALRMADSRPLWAQLSPEAERRLQSLWVSKHPTNRTLLQIRGLSAF